MDLNFDDFSFNISFVESLGVILDRQSKVKAIFKNRSYYNSKSTMIISLILKVHRLPNEQVLDPLYNYALDFLILWTKNSIFGHLKGACLVFIHFMCLVFTIISEGHCSIVATYNDEYETTCFQKILVFSSFNF